MDANWGLNGEDELALWDDWEEVPLELFDDWMVGDNVNHPEEVPFELFDNWDPENEMEPAQDQTSVPYHSDRMTKTPAPASGCKDGLSSKDNRNDDDDDDKSGGGTVIGGQTNSDDEEKSSPEGRVVGLPRIKEVMSTVKKILGVGG